MLKLVLALSIFLHTNMLLANPGPVSDPEMTAGPVTGPTPQTQICSGSNGTNRYQIKFGREPLVELTSCFTAMYEEQAYTTKGVICKTSYNVFLYFPMGGDWSCQRTSVQTPQLTCRGIDSKNRNQTFPLICR